MKSSTLFGLLIISIMTSCDKTICENARACVKNNTSDTVYYSWGGNWYSDTLLPGGIACNNLGEMDKYSTFNTMFNSDHGDISIYVDECNEMRDIK